MQSILIINYESNDRKHLESALCTDEYIKKLTLQISSLIKIKFQEMEKFNQYKNILTAAIQAGSYKNKEDSMVRFSLEPKIENLTFKQWGDAMKIIVKLPGGIHPSWRKRIWLAFANFKLSNVDWTSVKYKCFNFEDNREVEPFIKQIEKDLTRTGFQGVYDIHGVNVTLSCLKNVLLAYARWNKGIGYCQGLNIIAANILQVCDHCEESALKILIVLVEYVLPSGYFTKDMNYVSVDICAVKELLPKYAPEFNKKIIEIKLNDSKLISDENEPHIINVYMIKWLISLFTTCFKRELSLRILDSLIFFGSEILIRVSLVIWNKLQNCN